MRIAGLKTADNWVTFSAELRANPTDELWRTAYLEYYYERIKTRYLDPIASIKKDDKELGEGFAIVALFCTLIEFLESCETGRNFKNIPRSDKPNEYGWQQASGLFKNFLTRPPFDGLIATKLINDFYTDVRCGLLHEARTCRGWTISTEPSGGLLIAEMAGEIKIYRNELVPTLQKYFENYSGRLLAVADSNERKALRNAFLEKFDHLSRP